SSTPTPRGDRPGAASARSPSPAPPGRLIARSRRSPAVFYRPDFPPGGDFYNLAWQLGGAVAVRITERLRLGFGVRWMHVSNGQGLGAQNPSYEGVGFPVSLDWPFRLDHAERRGRER